MTKVDIISGFLGAGKTTFIKKLLSDVWAGEKLVLIENEFGEIGIDGGFLKDAGIEITEMNSGCICCTLVGDFSKALVKVLDEYHPDRVIIEPSGVGKLSDVARAIEAVEKDADIEIDGRITVVDGKKAKMYMKNFGEFFKDQVEHASTIVVSRTQMMTDEKVEECVHTLREENAEATIISTPWDELGKEAISHALTKGAEIESLLKIMKITIMITTIVTTITMTIMITITTIVTMITMTTIMITAITTIMITAITIIMTTIIMTMITIAAVDTITIITTIIMQMMCLQAGAKRLFINIPKKNWIIC